MIQPVHKNARYAHIDVLRAIAVLMVMFQHLYHPLLSATVTPWPIFETLHQWDVRFDFGRGGVYLFFIISGYVIPQSLLKYRDNRTRNFWISRFFRLYPAYWLSLAVTIVIGPAIFAPGVYIINVTMLQEFLGVPDAQGVYWTLAVEMLFYGLCTLLAFFGILDRGQRLEGVFLGMVGLGVAGALVRAATDVPFPFAWPMFLSLMLGGAVLRKRDREGKAADLRLAIAIGIFLGLGLLVSLAVYHDPDRFQKPWTREFGPWAAAVLLFTLIHFVFRIRWRPLAFVGMVSYSIYLFHVPLGHVLVHGLVAVGFVAAVPFPVSLAVTALLIFGVSSVIYFVIEHPSIEFGQRLIERWSLPKPEDAEPLEEKTPS
ncbi:acyltransferase family protein [Magnetospira thiophila]